MVMATTAESMNSVQLYILEHLNICILAYYNQHLPYFSF